MYLRHSVGLTPGPLAFKFQLDRIIINSRIPIHISQSCQSTRAASSFPDPLTQDNFKYI